jgi:hypothetical protein
MTGSGKKYKWTHLEVKRERGSMNKKILLRGALLLTAVSAFSLDFSLRPKGFVFIPVGPRNEAADGNARFDTGGGGELGLELDLASIRPNPLGLGYTLGIKGAFAFNPYKAPATGNAQLYAFGAVFRPLRRYRQRGLIPKPLRLKMVPGTPAFPPCGTLSPKLCRLGAVQHSVSALVFHS